MIKNFFNRYFELVFWITAMVCLAFTNPANHSQFSLCPFKAMGITWCPGCGIGHSIAYLFRGDIPNAFHTHWLGIPAVFAIFYRMYALLRPVDHLARIQQQKQSSQ